MGIIKPGSDITTRFLCCKKHPAEGTALVNIFAAQAKETLKFLYIHKDCELWYYINGCWLKSEEETAFEKLKTLAPGWKDE